MKIEAIETARLVANTWGESINPELEDADREALRDSLSRDGIKTPLVVWEHDGEMKVVCGTNRLRIASELGILTVPVVLETFADESEAKRRAIIDNVARRQLNPAQRAEMALEVQDVFRAGAGTRTDLKEPCSHANRVDSMAEAAKACGSSKGAMSQMRRILQEGDESLIRDVRSGKVSLRAGISRLKKTDTTKPETKLNHIEMMLLIMSGGHPLGDAAYTPRELAMLAVERGLVPSGQAAGLTKRFSAALSTELAKGKRSRVIRAAPSNAIAWKCR